jgi:dUTP pyrophosphatase
MQVIRLFEDAILPKRATSGSAGYDLFANESLTIQPGNLWCVSTGLSIKMPPGVYGRIAPRSGITVKYNAHVGAGVIDPDYTGEIKVVLCNNGKVDFRVSAGDRIAQLILEKFEIVDVKEVDGFSEVSVSERGSGGFGSTGI